MAEDGSYLPPVVLRIIGDDADLIRTLARDKELLDAFDGSSYEAKLTLDSTPAIAEAVRARSELEAIFSAPITQHVILDSGFGTVPELALPSANFQTTFDSTAAIEQATVTRVALDAIAASPIVFTATFDAGNVVAEAAAIIASQNLSPVTVQVTANDSNLIATLAGNKALLDDFSSRVYTANLTATGVQAEATAAQTRADLEAIAASPIEFNFDVGNISSSIAQVTAMRAVMDAMAEGTPYPAFLPLPPRVPTPLPPEITLPPELFVPPPPIPVEFEIDLAGLARQLAEASAAIAVVRAMEEGTPYPAFLPLPPRVPMPPLLPPPPIPVEFDVDLAGLGRSLAEATAMIAAEKSVIEGSPWPSFLPLPPKLSATADKGGGGAWSTFTASWLGRMLGGGGGGGGGGTLGWGGGLGGFLGFPGFARFGSVLGLAGLGAERAATTVGGVAASGIGALGGAGLLGAGVLGTTAVGAGSDIAVFRDAQAEVTAYGKGLDRLNRAIAIYGANSTQARAAQYDLNQVTKAFSPALLSAVQATNTAKTTLTAFWDQQTSMAKVSSLSIMDQVYKLGTVYTPLIAQAAGRNLGIINNDIKPLFAWLEGPQGIAIFQHLENIFAERLPTAIHAFTQGVEIIIKTINVAAGSTGSFIVTLDNFLTRTNSPTGFARWQTEIGHLIALFHDWTKLGVDLWGVMKQLFKGTTGLGTDIVVTLDQMLVRLHNWLSTTSGQASVHNLFLAHRQEIDAILQVLPQLLSGLGQFYLLIAPDLTHILTFLIQIASFVVHMPIIGPFLAWAAAILLIANRMKLLTLASWTIDVLKFAAAFVTLAGAQGMAATLSALPLVGGAIGALMVRLGLLDAATAVSMRGMLTFGAAAKTAAVTSEAAVASSATTMAAVDTELAAAGTTAGVAAGSVSILGRAVGGLATAAALLVAIPIADWIGSLISGLNNAQGFNLGNIRFGGAPSTTTPETPGQFVHFGAPAPANDAGQTQAQFTQTVESQGLPAAAASMAWIVSNLIKTQGDVQTFNYLWNNGVRDQQSMFSDLKVAQSGILNSFTTTQIPAAMSLIAQGLLKTSTDANALQLVWGTGIVPGSIEANAVFADFSSGVKGALTATQDSINVAKALWEQGDASLQDRNAGIAALTGLEKTVGPTISTYMQGAVTLWAGHDHNLKDIVSLTQTMVGVASQTSALSNDEQWLIAKEFQRGHGATAALVKEITAEQAIAATTGPLTGQYMQFFMSLWDKGVTDQGKLTGYVNQMQTVMATLQQVTGSTAPLSGRQMSILADDLTHGRTSADQIAADLLIAAQGSASLPSLPENIRNIIAALITAGTDANELKDIIAGYLAEAAGVGLNEGLLNIPIPKNIPPPPSGTHGGSGGTGHTSGTLPAVSYTPPAGGGGGRNYGRESSGDTNLPTITIPIEIHIHGNATAGDAQRIGLTVQQAVQAEVSQVVRQLIGGAA